MATATKPLTVRLPVDLYQATSAIAHRRKTSLNALVQEGLTTLMKGEEYARLYEAFGQLGDDEDESSVEFAAHAQREVICRGKK